MMKVESFTRTDFLTDHWEYNPGEHVSFIGPTGSGKTWFAYQLLRPTATPECPAIVMVMKPRDDTAAKFSKAVKYRTVRTWPAPPSIWQPGKRDGYVLWPVHTRDPDYDDFRHEAIFRSCLRDSFVKGDRILFADETVSLAKELDLKKDLVRIWTKGRSMGCGLWAATQRPAWVPPEMYDQAEHIFLAYDPDERNQDRFSEIGGVDPKLVKQVVQRLEKYQWLYIRRSDRTMCVVQA